MRDTGGTVVISTGPVLTGDSKKTVEFAVKQNKPCLYIQRGVRALCKIMRDFVADKEISTRNV